MTGQGFWVEREFEEEEADEEVDEEERGTELKALSSSSLSMIDGSHDGTGVQGCHPGATEQDFTS